MRRFIILCFIGIGIVFTSCRSDFNFEPTIGGLQFSKDTVYLDTVFKNIGSSTYTLKVYNHSDKDISIPTIQLGKGLASKYRMMVDGMQGQEGKIFKNVDLLANDSLFIFIETTADVADANPTDFLYTDKIQFGEGTNFQTVELVTLIQDAYFIYPNRVNGIYETVSADLNSDPTITTIRGRNLIENHPENGNEFEFKADKPYVVYGYASVPDGKTLTIPAGARVHFHKDSGLIVQDNATLKIDGALNNEVIFEGDRLEPFFSNVPGQWGLIYLRQGSKNHTIKYLTLKNATVGLYAINNVGTPIQIENTQIYDCSNVGIYAVATNIIGKNIVVNNAGQVALACALGGNYNFTHCTFNNNWPSSKQVSVSLNNYYLDNNLPVSFPLTQANFTNCIIYGSNQSEINLDKSPDSGIAFNYKFTNCLIKYSSYQTDPLFDFGNTALFSECLISKNSSENNPNFFDANKNKLTILETSAAINHGLNLGSDNFEDILGNTRPTAPYSNPDIGAYQFVILP